MNLHIARTHTTLAVGIAAAAALLTPAAANATYTSTAGAGGPVLTGDGAGDTLTISEAGGLLKHNRWSLADPGFNSDFDFDPAVAGDQTVSGSTALVTVLAGGGNDTVTVPAGNMGSCVIRGGEGNDTLAGSVRADMVFGDAGDDKMTALPGADTVAGGDGNDVMVWNNGDGTDKMDGEGNTDEVVVNGAAAGEQMAVTANGQRVKFDRTSPGPFSLDIGSTELLTINGGDGDDTISGASGLAPLILLSLNGGAAADTITGGDGSDLIAGGDGNDTLSGAGEQDRILGELGDDTTTGGDGDDTLVWNNGDNSDKIDGAGGFDQVEVNGSTSAGDAFAVAGNGDRAKLDRTNLVPFTLDIGSAEALQVNGLGGDDTLTSAPAPIGLNVDGGTGNDNLEVRDGTPGFVRCGSGTDSAVADESFVDLVLADCESVDRTLPTPPPPTPVADTTGLPVVIGGGTIRVTGKLGKAQAPIAVTCPAAETGGCRGRLTLTTAGPVRLGKARVVVVLGSANYALAAGKATKVKVKLPSTLKRIVGKKRTLKARAAAVGRDAAGNRSEAIGKRLTLRLPKR